MSHSDHNLRERLAAFEWLQSEVELHGETLSRTALETGFAFEGVQIRFVGPQGIFKPRSFSKIALSITTSPNGPYHDGFGPDGLLRYAYRGTDPQHHENVGLRAAMTERVPLVYFHGLMPGKYIAAWPVFIVGDDPKSLTFKVAIDDARHIGAGLDSRGPQTEIHDSGDDARRAYITSTFRRRVHQGAFRERVLKAYRKQCALCHLRHEELLDAAHIIPDAEVGGEPVVQNGLALCKLHHAAYDRNFLAVRPDYVIEVRRDLLDEEDGPMLLHGIQGFHQQRIVTPSRTSDRPDRDRLEERYAQFLASR